MGKRTLTKRGSFRPKILKDLVRDCDSNKRISNNFDDSAYSITSIIEYTEYWSKEIYADSLCKGVHCCDCIPYLSYDKDERLSYEKFSYCVQNFGKSSLYSRYKLSDYGG